MAFDVSYFGIAEDELPSGWRAERVDELAAFNPEQIGGDYPHSHIAYLDISNVGAGVIGEAVELPLENAPSRAKRIVRSNDSILSTVRPGNRTYAFMRNVPSNLVVSTGFAVLRAKPQKADPRFLYYLATTDPLIDYLASIAEEKTAYPSVNPTDIAECVVPIPPLSEQRAIADILGSLDDKIELNRRMNETLEAMARALFKSWFVDFDPVHAKAEGRDPGLPLHLAALFPDRFEDSELGEIPAGWRIGPILGHARLLSGGTPKTDRQDYWEGEIPWASAKDVSQCGETFLSTTERTITEKGLRESATQLIPAMSTVVVARGATTGRMVLFGSEMAMNQTCYALVSEFDTPFCLHFQLKHEIGGLLNAAHGSVFDTITTSTFAAHNIVLPSAAVLRAFDNMVSRGLSRILSNIEQSRTLAALRDTLLPKLLSGQLRIKDAERIAGVVA